jgi:hypothetical protein
MRNVSNLCLIVGLFLLFPWPALPANSVQDAVHELALKVCTSPHKGPVSLRWQETSESPGYWSDLNKKVFLDQIIACGISLAENSEATVLRVSAQVTASRILFVADSADPSNARQIHMIEIPRASLFNTNPAAPGPRLRSELIWQQPESIDSAMEWQDQSSQQRFLFLLSEGRLVRIGFENAAGRVLDSASLPVQRHSRLGDGHFAYMKSENPLNILLTNGKICGFDPTGRVTSFTCIPTTLNEQPPQISSNCDETRRFLAAGSRDYSEPDRIILRSVASDSSGPVPQGSELDSVQMPGPVLALGSAENAKASFAVVKNLSTGNHEVYRITALCSD